MTGCNTIGPIMIPILHTPDTVPAKDGGTDSLTNAKPKIMAPDANPTMVTSSVSIQRGIPGITVELGQEGRCSEPLVVLGEQIILNLMKHLGILEGVPEVPESQTIIKGTYLHSRAGGTFHPKAQVKDAVKQGDTVGVITDYLGEVLATVEAPYDGIICSIRTFPSIRPGEWTVFVGELVERV